MRIGSSVVCRRCRRVSTLRHDFQTWVPSTAELAYAAQASWQLGHSALFLDAQSLFQDLHNTLSCIRTLMVLEGLPPPGQSRDSACGTCALALTMHVLIERSAVGGDNVVGRGRNRYPSFRPPHRFDGIIVTRGNILSDVRRLAAAAPQVAHLVP